MKKEVRNDAELEKLSAKNFIWSLSRYVIAEKNSRLIPSWSGFQKLIYKVENTKASVGYLPLITLPPIEMKVIFAVIDCFLDILLKLEQIILEVDQVIYLKIFDAMFRMKDDGMMIFDKIIPRLGGFHIVLCMIRTLYCRFKAASTQFLK